MPIDMKDVPYKTGPLANMTNEEIFRQADEDDEKQKNIKDPFEEGEKLFGCKKKMFKKSMQDLKRLTEK